jgi:hypothetical protein
MFEYVPIPESPQRVTKRSLYYRDLPARRGGSLAQYVPHRLCNAAAHYDPEFETFTYGDPTRNKRGQLLRLEYGDLLVFYAGLQPEGFQGANRLYIIGYFTVESVVSMKANAPWPPTNFRNLRGNAHLRRDRLDSGLVVVRGNAHASKLLERAVAISDEAQFATPETEERLGVRGSLKRAIGRWVPSERIADAVGWIMHEGGSTANKTHLRTLIYKRTHEGDPDPDTGVFGGKKCMGKVRGWKFDAVIGVGGIGREPEEQGIDRRLTWVGIGPHKTGDPRCPLVAFDHFLYCVQPRPLLKDVAPNLAKRMYDGNVRVILNSLSKEEKWDVERILELAKDAPPSSQLTGAPQQSIKKTVDNRRSNPCRGGLAAQDAEQENPADTKERRG